MKSIDEVRAIIAAEPRKSCTPSKTCPGWVLANGSEIQVCDDCFAGILNDDDVAQLPEAKAKLNDARVGLDILEALVALRNARGRLKKARAPQAKLYLQHAIKSAAGALDHAERRLRTSTPMRRRDATPRE